jgi:uridine kinase
VAATRPVGGRVVGASVRERLLAEVAEAVPRPGRPVLVAVDGADGSGKTTFADDLALALPGRPVVRASVDDFHFSREHRYAEGRTGETVWRRSFDYSTLRRELLDPWLTGAGASYRSRWHDLVSDDLFDCPRRAVPEDGVLVVDCLFAQRPELDGVWDLVVYLDCPDDVRVARMVARDGRPSAANHPDQRRYLDAQRIYRELCRPLERADVVVDNTDPQTPDRVWGGVAP